jgi:pheromone shutdown-related protein TraB
LLDKSKLLASVLVGLFEEQQLDEAELRRIRERDVLSELMNELGRVMPGLRRVLIDERDAYLAQRIRDSHGQKVVAVVGAGHVMGMRLALEQDLPVDMEEISRVPAVPTLWKVLGWALPALILASIAGIAVNKGVEAATHSALYWIVANSVPAAIGTALALGHPLTVLAALISAPFTSLSPLIGVGHVTAFVQAYVHSPRVHEFSTVTEDLAVASRWWKSRLLRVLLVFVLSSIGGLIGVWVGGLEVLTTLF